MPQLCGVRVPRATNVILHNPRTLGFLSKEEEGGGEPSLKLKRESKKKKLESLFTSRGLAKPVSKRKTQSDFHY